jgi:hypothetical protein
MALKSTSIKPGVGIPVYYQESIWGFQIPYLYLNLPPLLTLNNASLHWKETWFSIVIKPQYCLLDWEIRTCAKLKGDSLL